MDMGLLGALVAVMLVPAWVGVSAVEQKYPPRKTLAHLAAGFSGIILASIFLPLLVALALVYVVIALINNDWAWYEILLDDKRR